MLCLCFSVAMWDHCVLRSSGGLFDFAEILTDEAGLLRNRFFFCRCVVAINAEEIYRFEVGVLK